MRGFTLVEVVIYIGLLGMLIGGAAVAAFLMLDSGMRSERLLAIQQEGAFVASKVAAEISQAASASGPAGHTLVLEPGPVVLTEADGRLTISRAGGEAVALTSSAVTVANTRVTVVDAAGGVPTSVEVRYTLDDEEFFIGRFLHD